MKVGVVGLGVVGNTVRTAFQAAGIRTVGYDLYRNIGTLEAFERCDVIFVAVPTPNLEDGSFDLTEVWNAVSNMEKHAPGSIVALKSTPMPGTIEALAEDFPGLRLAMVPEFLVAERALESFLKPDRVVIGAYDPEVANVLEEVMRLVVPSAPMLRVSPLEAEFAKLCSNAFLSAKVGFANQLRDLVEAYGADWSSVQALVGLDRRIGPDHITVTVERGFGGVCLPKDLAAAIAAARKKGVEPSLLTCLEEYNRKIRRSTDALV